MKEYIERASVEKFIQDGLNNPDKDKAFGHDAIEILAGIHFMLAADVVPVVRCRECEHWKDWGACGHPDNGWDAPPMGPEDFCSRGERR